MGQVIFLCERAFIRVAHILIVGDLGWSLVLQPLLKGTIDKEPWRAKGQNLQMEGEECKGVTQVSFGGSIHGGSQGVGELGDTQFNFIFKEEKKGDF